MTDTIVSSTVGLITSKDPGDRAAILAENMTKAGCSFLKIGMLLDYDRNRKLTDVSKLYNKKDAYYVERLKEIVASE